MNYPKIVIGLLALPLAAACGEPTAVVDCAQAAGTIEVTFEHPYGGGDSFPIVGEMRLVALDEVSCPGPDRVTISGLHFEATNLSKGRYALFLETPDFVLRDNAPHVEVDVSWRTPIYIPLNMTPDPREFLFEVAPETGRCFGGGEQWDCMQVRGADPGDDRFLNFYDQIDGFDFVPGYHYQLRVLRTRKPNIGADEGIYEYRLLELISRTPA